MFLTDETMFFTCNKCKYTFESVDTLDRCPDCGMIAVRKATDEEVEEYREYRRLFDQEDADSDERKVSREY